MKRILMFLTLALMLLLGACGKESGSVDKGSDGKKENYVISIGHAVNESHSQHKTFEKFKEYVEEKSDSKIIVEIYPNGQIGNDRELIEGVQVGTVIMAAPSTAPVAGFVPEFEIYDLPFLFENREKAYEVLDGSIGDATIAKLAGTGMKGLGYWENGYRHLTNSRNPVKTPEDLANMVVRTMENPMHVSTWKALGANPTPMAWADVFVSLQQGTLDGQENPLGTIYDQKVYEAQKYLTLTGHVYSPFIVLINEKFYNDLPEDLQKIVDEGVEVATVENRKLAGEVDAETIEALKETGIEVTELTPDEIKAFQDKTSAVYEEYKEKIDKDLINDILEATK